MKREKFALKIHIIKTANGHFWLLTKNTFVVEVIHGRAIRGIVLIDLYSLKKVIPTRWSLLIATMESTKEPHPVLHVNGASPIRVTI